MMDAHLSLEQLLQLEEPGAEPGVASARAHLERCESCRLEADRLLQRSARLRALSSLRPPRDGWPALRARLEAERRARYIRRMALVGLAAAATLAVAVLLRPAPRAAGTSPEVVAVMDRSQRLERFLQAYDPESRVIDGATARAAGNLEDRIAAVDRDLEAAQLLDERQREEAMLQLWRQRVGLLDALVDVHMTQASAVGF